jgi:hypothetical protein
MRETGYEEPAFLPSPRKYADLPPWRFHNTTFSATNKIQVEMNTNMNI